VILSRVKRACMPLLRLLAMKLTRFAGHPSVLILNIMLSKTVCLHLTAGCVLFTAADACTHSECTQLGGSRQVRCDSKAGTIVCWRLAGKGVEWKSVRSGMLLLHPSSDFLLKSCTWLMSPASRMDVYIAVILHATSCVGSIGMA